MTNFFAQIKPELWHEAHTSAGLKLIRDTAWRGFLDRGLPSSRDEAWHYTDLNKFLKQTPVPTVATGTAPQAGAPLAAWSGHVAVFLDGCFLHEQSRLPNGVNILSLDQALSHGFHDFSAEELIEHIRDRADRASEEHGGLIDLQQALMNRGVVLHVADSVQAGTLKLQLQWSTPAQATLGVSTHFMWLGANSSLTLIEESLNPANLTTTLWTHVDLAQSARLEYIRLQQNQPAAISLGLFSTRQQLQSELSAVCLLVGGHLARETWLVDHSGETASTKVSALLLGSAETQLDLRTVLNHEFVGGQSEQRVRLLAADQSRAIFNGKVVIAKDAQTVNTSQLTRGLLLSEKAEIDAKPQLEIYADNVKASHGASVGQMDEEELFYLRSRGLTRPQAEHLLGEGFAREAVSQITDSGLRATLENWLSGQMHNLIQPGELL
ncbi:MAG: SufD family Fe-S cluster assembly protein [Bdellovibrionales bacterium]